MSLKIQTAIETIKNLYLNDNQLSFLLLGATGIGKSENVNKLAKDLNLPIIEFDLSIVEPVDLLGLPVSRDNSFEYLPIKVLYNNIISRPGILFLDELTNVQRTDVLSAALRIVLDRKIGIHKLHPKTLIIAAGNRLEDSSLVSELPVPLINRFVVLEIEKPNPKDWIQYMSENYEEWDKSIAAFLSKFPNYIHYVPSNITQTLSQVATPRTWTQLALISKEIEDDLHVLEEVASGLVGKEAASHFITFRNTKLPDEEDLRKDFKGVWSKTSIAAKYMLAVQFRDRPIKDVLWFMDNLADIPDHEILVLLFTIVPNKNKQILITTIIKKRPNLRSILVNTFRELSKFIEG